MKMLLIAFFAGFFSFTFAYAQEPVVTINPGNVLKLSVSADPSISRNYTVSEEGTISIPGVGVLDVKEKKLSEVRDQIAKVISANYRNGSFSLVLSSAKIYVKVAGLVKKPGTLHLSSRSTLEDAIVASDGFSPGAKLSRIEIRRKNQTVATVDMSQYYRTGDRNLLPVLESMDQVFIPGDENLGTVYSPDGISSASPDAKITILGEVRNPGVYAFQQGAKLTDYLTKAGGPTASAEYGQIIIKIPGDKTHTLDLIDYMKGSEKEPQLSSGAEILVAKADVSWFDRNLGRLSLIGGIVSTIALLIIAF